MKRYIPLYIAAMLLTGCSDEPGINIPAKETPAGLPITLDAAYPTATRASDAGFDHGDRMGVYVLDYADDAPQSISDLNAHAANVRFEFNATDNSWRGATDIYWTSATTAADIIAYYPFQTNIDDPETVNVSVMRRQDRAATSSEAGGYEQSDVLWAKAAKTMPTESSVNLTLRHVMAGVRVRLTQGSGFAAGEWAGLEKTVLVTNTRPDATLNLASGEVSAASGTPISIVPLEAAGEWRAIVVPQTVAAGEELLSLTVDGTSYSLSKTEAFAYAGGKLHTFTVKVDKRTDTGKLQFSIADEAITAWIDDVEFRDGLLREYVTIDVTEPGTLRDCIVAKGLTPSEITNLKVTGKINQDDIRDCIRDEMTSITALNLYDCTVYDGNVADKLCDAALADKSQLTHVVFPKNLKIIGNRAFRSCGLIGDLIIPEGVTHIGTYANPDEGTVGHYSADIGVFADCPNLCGKLSLPSTLEFIENAAFIRVPLYGDLIIPENVKVIGSMAFDTSKFDGTLSLPKNLEVIGKGAFYRVHVSGEVNFPQGIDKIRESTFGETNITHLTIPEGVIEIEGGAFAGSALRGELKLPSTLRMLGTSAFANTKISNIIFPEHLVFMGAECFEGCSRLSGTLTLPESLPAVNAMCFRECTMLDEVIIGSKVTKIEGGAFANCYNLSSMVVNNPEPPTLTCTFGGWGVDEPFYGIPKDNFTLQVPQQSVEAYKQADMWREFKRISAYSNFVCRPAAACALPTRHTENLILNADGDWTVTHIPDWCTLSRTSGHGKTELTLTINELSQGSGNREDRIEFALTGTEHTTSCTVSQYDCQWQEDQCVALQRATVGRGIDVLFVGDGFDAKAIAEGEYMALVREQMEAFFGLEPYTTYRNRFNVYACMSLSQETGVNTAYTWRNTRFNTLYAGGSLMHDNIDDVFDYAVANSPLTANTMPQSLIIMALNSDEYGSATTMTWQGSAVAICSPSADAYPMDTRGLVQHEACGHAFGKLGEERIVKNLYAPQNVKDNINDMNRKGWYKNISTTGKLTDVAWRHFIFDPRYSDKVDVYEGAMGYTRGVYRSEINSCMNYCIPYFNAISRQSIVERILNYSGEGFSMEKFYATDSDRWGATNTSRAAMPATDVSASGLHHPVRIVKSKKY